MNQDTASDILESMSNRSVSDMDENETIGLEIKEYCDSDNVKEAYYHTETECEKEVTKTKFAEWLDEFNTRPHGPDKPNPNDMLQTDSRNEGMLSSEAEQIQIHAPIDSNSTVVHNTSMPNSQNYGTESYISPGQYHPYNNQINPQSFNPGYFTPVPYYPYNNQINSQNISPEYCTPHQYSPTDVQCVVPAYRIPLNSSTPVSPMQAPFQRFPRNINRETASEKCKYLRRIRLQIPNDKVSPSKIPQRYSSKGNSPSNLRSWRSAIKQDPVGNSSPSTWKYHKQRLSLDSKKNDHSNASSSKENNSGNSSLSLSFHSARSDELHSSWEYNSLDSSQEDKIEEPVLNSYQLLGDSLLVRFAEQILRREVKLVHGTRTIGMCVSGQKLMDLLHKVSMKEFPLTKKLIVLIGTNDILQNTGHDDMCATLKYLLGELLLEAKRIILLTIPPIPKLQDRSDQWDRIENYNRYIKSLQGLFVNDPSCSSI
ncbi:hypothetical protein C0J52_03294 [Blattella germanica]|nr:hypothetical protein C0J52_03294 [Blattella germanica]